MNVIKSLNYYLHTLLDMGYEPKKLDNLSKDFDEYSKNDLYGHLIWMCQEALEFEANDPEKAHHWLGFIQGVLWAENECTIDEMREHNKA
jgi:hypothetical protein